MPDTGRKNTKFTWSRQGIYYNQEESLDIFLDNKGEFYNDIEAATGGVL